MNDDERAQLDAANAAIGELKQSVLNMQMQMQTLTSQIGTLQTSISYMQAMTVKGASTMPATPSYLVPPAPGPR